MEVSIIGAGAWGSAFALHLARRGYNVLLWVYEKELCDILKKERQNRYFLPGFEIPETVRFTTSMEAAEDYAEDIVIATPSFALRKTIERASGRLERKKILILTKGLETETLKRMSEVVYDVTGKNYGVASLSGPSFAKELAQEAFTSVVVASEERPVAKYFQSAIHSDNFRVYTSEDIVGVELGGALKNVMAIGAGIIEGLGLGTNALAAFTTRALAEMKRLGKALGATETTFMGLSGIGDLMLTSYGNLSRNRQFGILIAQGQRPEHLIKVQKNVVEGYYTINAARKLARANDVEMPITEELYRVVYEGKNLHASLNDMKQREFKEEDT